MNNRGKYAEDVAVRLLKKNGYKILERNFHCYFGEIDIIAKEQEYLVFVEVKFRKREDFGGAVGAVTPLKQTKIKKTAQVYLQKNRIEPAVRFDVVLLSGEIDRFKKVNFEIIKDAFR